MKLDESLNVFGTKLEPCSVDPMTGYFRNGCCDTSELDQGGHTVCVLMTEEFLAYSKLVGNDLSTPVEEYGFPGLKEGDRWCLCASRFLQAYQEGAAPRVVLKSTHAKALDVIPLEYLKELACDLH